jgi:hypothetical protein
MEAWYAHASGKPVVAYTGGAPPHPWTVYSQPEYAPTSRRQSLRSTTSRS